MGQAWCCWFMEKKPNRDVCLTLKELEDQHGEGEEWGRWGCRKHGMMGRDTKREVWSNKCIEEGWETESGRQQKQEYTLSCRKGGDGTRHEKWIQIDQANIMHSMDWKEKAIEGRSPVKAMAVIFRQVSDPIDNPLGTISPLPSEIVYVCVKLCRWSQGWLVTCDGSSWLSTWLDWETPRRLVNHTSSDAYEVISRDQIIRALT
jgi:hypothetical protein